MINAGVLTFQEFAMREPLPLAEIHEAVLDFLQGRDDVALFGAQAVNAYVAEPRMTQDVDLLSTRAGELAEELREHLSQKFHIALRVREVAAGKIFRVYQVRGEGNRHLIDLRFVDEMPKTLRIEDVLVLSPPELIASKVVSYHSRRGKPKAGTGWRDLAMLLLKFPELKTKIGEVSEILRERAATQEVREVWRELVATEIQLEDENDDLIF
jgi:hypothetical protein